MNDRTTDAIFETLTSRIKELERELELHRDKIVSQSSKINALEDRLKNSGFPT